MDLNGGAPKAPRGGFSWAPSLCHPLPMTRASSPRGPRRNAGLPILLVCSFAALSSSCSSDEEAAPEITVEDTLTRERVSHWFDKNSMGEAREVLAPLVAGEDAQADDLLRAATIEFADSKPKAAEAFLARAEAKEPDSAALHFLRGQMASESGRADEALRELTRAHELVPDDVPTRYLLARAHRDLDQYEEAEVLLRGVLEVGIENGQSWYVSSVHLLRQMLTMDQREDEAAALNAEFKRLQARGFTPLDANSSRFGTFGRIVPPNPNGSVVPTPPNSLTFAPVELDLPGLAGALELLPHDVDGDGRMDLVARLADGVAVALQGRKGWTTERVFESPVDMAVAFDLDNETDGGLELLVTSGNELSFIKRGLDGWAVLPVQTPELPQGPADITPVDYDHEGDIDLLLVGAFGARIWRNDGAWIVGEEAQGEYADVTAEASLPQGVELSWSVTEDIDGDNDVDVLVGGPGRAFLGDSLRAGRFADLSDRLPAELASATEPLLADFNGDGRTDIVLPGEPLRFWTQTEEGRYEAVAVTGAGDGVPVAVDLDLDGSVDLVFGDGAQLAFGLVQRTGASLEGLAAGETPLVLDADGDWIPDLLRATSDGVSLLRAEGARGGGCPIKLLGNRSNKRGMGSIVEVRAGGMYRRIYYRGEPVIVGRGAAPQLDVLRITYPNGIMASKLDHVCESGDLIDDMSAAFELMEPSQLSGSCPFLYTWNGETYEFITDVLGITPLGLPMAPGMMVPPDHDEFVLVRGEQLKEEDGLLKMQFTEELREVTYLDRVRLDVVDHPADAEVYPNELFKFPPFPEEHLHTVEAPLPVLKATDHRGADWTEALAAMDEDHALPFDRLPPQFNGLAEPWFLELEFDPEAVKDREKLRLVMTGWFLWSNASVNVAAARTPGVDFIPPIIQVPDGEGGWRDTGPPVGFPAGKTKTMLIDVSDIGLQERPRLRIFCTLQLYWDRIVLATCDDDGERRITSLEPATARLWRRGFSEEIPTGNTGSPLRFEWERVSEVPRWNPHPGRYTRLGECLPLVQEIDDRYVIMGTGEALEVHFDASSLPPLPEGWRRDYLVFLDGWAKDRDPNTLEALYVEPLPFHGMSGYPYGEDEHFPDDEVHEEWRREWNTREPQDWLPSLVPGR